MKRNYVNFVLIFLFVFLIPNVANAGFLDTFIGGLKDFVLGAMSNLTYLLMTLAGVIMGITGVLLNYVIQCTVVDMATTVRDISAINITWAVIRDIANMSFIFILLYTAIGTILGISGADWKKTVIRVVVVAILINFSLFFTKVIVDGSNVVALGFYEAIAPTAANSTCEAFNFDSGGLSDSYAQALKMTKLYDAGTLTGEARFLTSVFGTFFLLIAAFVFAAAAILFIARFVTIIFLMILSPIGLLGSVLPQLKKYSSQWWDTLIGQAVFAPVFMLMSWVVVVIINDPQFFGNNTGTASFAAGDDISPGSIQLVMNFIVVIAFMVATLILSKQASSQGMNVGKKIVGSALGLGAGAAGWAGRRTIGGAGRSLADNESLKEAASKKGAGGFAARMALKSSQKVAKGSFDVRSSRFAGMGGALGMGDLGIDGKAGGKGGYDAYIKEQAKKHDDFQKTLGPSDIEKDQAKAELEKAKESKDPTKIATAQARVDRLEGVDPKQVEKRKKDLDEEKDRNIALVDNAAMEEADAFATTLEQEVQRREQEIQKTIIPQLKEQRERELENTRRELARAKEQAERARAENQNRKQEITRDYENRKNNIGTQVGVGKQRTAAYAETITSTRSGWGRIIPDGNRNFLYGKVKRSHQQAAADIRKGKKSVTNQLEEILRDAGEIPAAGTGTTPGGTATPPATPPPAGGTTP